MNTIIKILFSNRLTGMLFVVFAVAMAVGTFMDAGQDTSPTPLTRNLIYNAWWFEAIMLLFVINFFGNIQNLKQASKEELSQIKGLNSKNIKDILDKING